MQTVTKVLDLLTHQERRRASLLLSMVLIMAILDMAGVASIMPFMAVLAKPELVETNTLLQVAFIEANRFGIDTTEQFIFMLGVFVFVLLLVSLAFKALTTYAQLRFALMREYTIGKRLVEGYLHQPYSWFLARHSADLGKNILSEVQTVIFGAVYPLMTIIAQGAVVSVLLVLLVLIDPSLALTVGLTLATAYILVFKVTRRYLTRIGADRVKANRERFTAVSEAFGATKEVKVRGLEPTFIRRFSGPARTYVRHQVMAKMISQLPRFALEAIAFGGMLLVVLYLMTQKGGLASALPIIALYAFAGYRLMPALQQVYNAATQLRFSGAALDSLRADLLSLQPAYEDASRETIELHQAIILDNIQYTYPNASQPALKNLSLTIPAKSTVGLVGKTGSGKTTVVDLILGLLDAQEGSLDVDGRLINEKNRYAWQRSIGYVPQHIYLTDDTVAANIAFGVDTSKIDRDAMERAAKIANIHRFVTDELPEQYETTVGERGVRLSGGQRQRIGIARALYHNPRILVLDEATSALDRLTEQAVIEAVNNLTHKITIILIAHRLSTVKICDTIFFLERGELEAQGTFDELLGANESFREMAVSN